MDHIQLSEIVNDVKLGESTDDFQIINSIMGHGFFVQVSAFSCGSFQNGRKWYISEHATKSEVVQTLLKAVLAFIEHEIREQFTYKGRAIFGPHFDVDALVDVVDTKSNDVRS